MDVIYIYLSLLNKKILQKNLVVNGIVISNGGGLNIVIGIRKRQLNY